MAEDKVISLGAVRAEVLFEIGGSLHLNVADVRAEAIADAKETLVRTSVPSVVGYWPGREKRNLERGVRRTGAIPWRSAATSPDCQQRADVE